MAKVCPGHLRSLKIWNASWICLTSLRRGHANLLCIIPILICVAVANMITQFYTWIDKLLSLAKQPLLVVALDYGSFAPSPCDQTAVGEACGRSYLDVTWANKQRSTRSLTHCQYGEGFDGRMITGYCWKYGIFHGFACHSWAGVMLIFSVWFQL